MMSYVGYIYKTILPNGSYYIGQKRKSEVSERYYGSGVKITNYIKKHGTSELRREILGWAKTNEELNQLEEESLRDVWQLPECLNLIPGGMQPGFPEEVRKKISEANKGRKRTKESIEKQKQSAKLFWQSETSKKNREKNRLVHTGKDCSNRKPHSKESHQRQGRTYSKRYLEDEKFKRKRVLINQKTAKNPERNKKISIAHRQMKWYTNGNRNTKAKTCPPGYKPGRTLYFYTSEMRKKASERTKQNWEKRR